MSCVINWFMLGTQLQSSWQYALGAGGRGAWSCPGVLGDIYNGRDSEKSLEVTEGASQGLGSS